MNTQELFISVAAIGRRFGAQRVVLFGSRARSDHRERSDVDLAIYGVPRRLQPDFADAIDDLPTLLSFDLVFIGADSNRVSAELLSGIERDGIDVMTKFNEKYAKFCLAVDRLEEAIKAYSSDVPDIVRDGIIQRFEFCTELAWKTAREYLTDEGVTDINTPKKVMREAYAAGLVQDDALWCRLLADRNQTSYTYNEETAQAIFSRICTDYLRLFRQLTDTLRRKCGTMSNTEGSIL